MLDQEHFGTEFNVPEPEELREEGYLKRARDTLMSTGKSYEEKNGDYLEALRGTVSSFGAEIVSKKELRDLKKCCIISPKQVLKKTKVTKKKAPTTKRQKRLTTMKRIIISNKDWGLT